MTTEGYALVGITPQFYKLLPDSVRFFLFFLFLNSESKYAVQSENTQLGTTRKCDRLRVIPSGIANMPTVHLMAGIG